MKTSLNKKYARRLSKLRSKYRRRVVLWGILGILVGFAVGFLLIRIIDNRPAVVAPVEVIVTESEKGALETAEWYLDGTGFSYSGMKLQLQYDGYSEQEILYALSNLNVNWNEQALRVAKQHQEVKTYDPSQMSAMLEFEGFTKEQSEYAINKLY